MSSFSGIPGVPSTSVPDLQFTPAGVVLPSEGDILAGRQIDINYAFGGGVNPALNTPQGQIASSDTAIIADKNNAFAYLVNQFDPQYADGRFQDGLARIYLLSRKGATSTVVTCDLGGLSGTLIPAATLAQDSNGNTYSLLGDVTIPFSGAASSSWANVATGPIPCPAGTLNQVYQAIPGWDTITNPSDGALGQNVETRAEFEFRRKNSVALNSRGTVPSIYANVFNVDGVLDCYALDNPKGYAVNVGATNYPMVAHSLLISVIGGTDADIAEAIWNKKSDGCDYNGNTTVIVTDPSGYNYPQPTYAVTFERPNPLAAKFQVQIANSPSLPSNIATLVQAAVVARFYGTDGTSRERIGATILASRYYSAISLALPNAVLLGVLVGAPTATATSLAVGVDQYPTLTASDVAVTLV